LASRAERAPAATLSLVRAVPIWVWLGAMVAVSAGVRLWLGQRMPGPWIMVDELIYSELGRSLTGGELAIRGEPTGSYGVVYPLLISPAYALFDSLPSAYVAVKAINAALVSLAAVPAYLLARRLLSRELSLLAAVLALAPPSLVYTGTVMTENAFYPLFLLVALVLVRTLERPTLRRQLALLVLCGLAYETRPQAVALVAAALTAPLLLGWSSVKAHRLLYGLVLGGGALLVLAQLVRGGGLSGLLGAYGVVAQQSYDAGEIAKWLLYHVAELDLYLGVFPLVALVALLARWREHPPELRAFLAATVALTAWLTLVVAVFASRFALRVQERNLYYVVPLLAIVLLAWVSRGAPRPRPVLAAAAAAGLLPAVLPYRSLIDVPARSDTLMLLPWWQLQDSLIALDQVVWVATACTLLAAAVFVLVPARYALALPVVVLAYWALALWPVEAGPHGVQKASAGALFAGIAEPRKDWVDRAVRDGAEVAVLWTGNVDVFAVWENEFFSRSVGTVYSVTDWNPGNLPVRRVSIREDGYVVDGQGERIEVRYVLLDGSVTPRGTLIAADERKGMFVYRVDGLLRSLARVRGLYPNDTWSGREVEYRRLECSGGSLAVKVHGDPNLFPREQRITARSGARDTISVVLRPGAELTLSVRLRPRNGVCTAGFAVTPTARPSEVTKGANPDSRELGTHFDSFTYTPPQ
jgi:4-amino-4-deoxy-L-arabinose transferase-like glycosyltransferase